MKRLLALVAALAVTAAAHADPVETLRAFVRDVKSGRAQFTQTVTSPDGAKKKTSSGSFEFSRPNRFRFAYVKPFEQTIVGDGEKVWIYDADLEQVTVRAQGTEEAHSPLTVLTDLTQLDRDFSTSEQGEHDGLVWLRLKSKDKEPQFAYADLGFDAGGLARMQFEDTLGDKTEIRFSGWSKNPPLPVDQFRFTPPPGVDVVGDPTPAATAHPVKD